MAFFNLPIIKTTLETPDALSICFQVPEDLSSTFTFKAGQYVTLKQGINGELIQRCYSISSDPNEKGQFTVAVKRVEKGLMSNYLLDSAE